MTVGASYNDTKIKDAALTGAAALKGSNPTVLDPVDANGNYSIYDNPLPNAPKWIANLTARYSIPTAAGNEFYRLHRLGLPQQGQLLPVRGGRVHRQGADRRRPARRLHLGQRQVRSRDLSPQHHQPGACQRRDRLQQLDRLHQRPAHLRRAVQGDLLMRH
jgi:hypothetical protein